MSWAASLAFLSRRRVQPGLLFLIISLVAAGALGSTPARAVAPFNVVTTLSVSFTSELVVSGNYAYVASDSQITIIDTSTNQIDAVVATTGARRPDGAATIGDDVYFAAYTDNKLITLDTSTRTVSYLSTTGCTSPSQLRVVNASRLIANCHGSGNVQVYDVTGTPSIVGTVSTGAGPRGMAVNNGLVYVPNSGANTLTVVDAAASTPAAVRTINVGAQPEFAGYLDGKVYSANFAANTVSVIDGTSYSVIATLPVGNNPQGLAPCVGNMYSANRWTGNTSVISPSSDSVIETITLGGVAAITHVVGANGRYAYFLNFDLSSVSVVDCDSRTVTATVSLTAKPSKIAFGSQYAYVTTTGAPGKISVISIPADSVDPGASDASIAGASYVDFRFLLPDGRECTAISPVRVRVGSMYQLPGVDASCQTVEGSSVAGWTIPVPQGFTGYGSIDEPFPPGLSVRVVDSQRFTVVPKEPTLRADFDANIAEADACAQTKTLHTSHNGRIEHVWVPRVDITMARFPASSSCVPDGHVLIGWNTTGDGSGETFDPGSAMPQEWGDENTNTRHLYAVWAPATN